MSQPLSIIMVVAEMHLYQAFLTLVIFAGVGLRNLFNKMRFLSYSLILIIFLNNMVLQNVLIDKRFNKTYRSVNKSINALGAF